MSSGSIRIIQLPEKSSVNTDDYMAVDSSANGTKKVKFTDLLDNNLSAQNKAADAQATGEAINDISARVDNMINTQQNESVTTLWTGTLENKNQSVTLSESIANFDFIDVYGGNVDVFYIRKPVTNTIVFDIQTQNMSDDASVQFLRWWETGVTISGTTATITKCIKCYWDDFSQVPVVSQATGGVNITRIDGVKIGHVENDEIVDARVGANGVTYSTLGDAIRGQVTDLESIISDNVDSITSKMIKIESNNYAKTGIVTMGYVAQNGTVYPSSSLWYTDKIPVEEGDVVRLYTYAAGAFTAKYMRFVCAYNASGQAVPASGAENTSAYTVPSGITSVVLTSVGTSTTPDQLMITRNYQPTAYEPYFAPYYIASEDFIEEAMSGYEIPEEPVKGYNLLKTAQTGDGYYYGSSVGSSINFGSSSSYKFAIIPVKKNTVYVCNRTPRFWVFTDDNDIVTSFGESGYVHNSGNGTKLFYSISSGEWNWEEQYGSTYTLIVSEGYYATYKGIEKPAFINNLSQNMMEAKYGCALPKKEPRFTVGIDQIWYDANILALDSNKIDYAIGNNSTYVLGGNKISFSSPVSASNNYSYRVYDEHLACIAQQMQQGYKASADNVQNCTVLVIGDSTVAQNYMTQTMLDAFAERNKTLTLLGTRGTAPNNHEGRAGWSTYDYCTQASKGGIVNPFYNNGFDFSYYMTNQGYSAPDFVVIQLGINDIYGVALEDSQGEIENTADRIISMLDSIWSYNASQKVILNLPTALNSNQTKQYHMLFALKNIFIRYNEYIQYRLLDTPITKARVSNCHLILNPDDDISDDVHPTEAGYAKMGMEVVSQINCWQNNY